MAMYIRSPRARLAIRALGPFLMFLFWWIIRSRVMLPMTPTAKMRQDRTVLMYLNVICMEVVRRQLGSTRDCEELLKRGFLSCLCFRLCLGRSFSPDARVLFSVSCETLDSLSETRMRLLNLKPREGSVLGEPGRSAGNSFDIWDGSEETFLLRPSGWANSDNDRDREHQVTTQERNILDPGFWRTVCGAGLRKSQIPKQESERETEKGQKIHQHLCTGVFRSCGYHGNLLKPFKISEWIP